MFGYVTVDKMELKGKDYYRYKAFYCGLCKVLYDKYGRKGQITLTYDMTFLTLLFTSLYEKKSDILHTRCLVHPCKKHAAMINEFTVYAADMNIALAYYNSIDNWRDDNSIKGLVASAVLKKEMPGIRAKYKRQCDVMKRELKLLTECEKRGEKDIDAVAYHFGKITEELFVYKQDIWEENLRKMGFYFGKFIYLMDAWDDLDKDISEGKYNVFADMSQRENFDKECEQILIMMIAECSRNFELMPILKNQELLRNILYSGVWLKWDMKHRKSRNGGKNGSI